MGGQSLFCFDWQALLSYVVNKLLIATLTLHGVDLAQELKRFVLLKRGKKWSDAALRWQTAIAESGSATQRLSKVICFQAQEPNEINSRKGDVKATAVHKVVLCNFFFRINLFGLLKVAAQFSKASIWRFSSNVNEATYAQMQIERGKETAFVNICASHQLDRLCLCCPAAVKQLFSAWLRSCCSWNLIFAHPNIRSLSVLLQSWLALLGNGLRWRAFPSLRKGSTCIKG